MSLANSQYLVKVKLPPGSERSIRDGDVLNMRVFYIFRNLTQVYSRCYSNACDQKNEEEWMVG